MFKEKIDKFFGWLFIITIVLLYPVFWLNGVVHNVRRMIDKKYNEEWLEIESRFNSQLNSQEVIDTTSPNEPDNNNTTITLN